VQGVRLLVQRASAPGLWRASEATPSRAARDAVTKGETRESSSATPWNRTGRAPCAPASVGIGEANRRLDALLELLLHVAPLREEEVFVQQILRRQLQRELLIEQLEREDHDCIELVAGLEIEAGEQRVCLAHPYDRLARRVVEQTIDVAPRVLVL